MRPLEVASAAILSLCLLAGLFPYCKGRISSTLAILCALVLAVQALREGSRWQLGPFYIAFFFLIMAAFSAHAGPSRLRILATSSGLMSVAGGIFLCLALPVFQFPRPTGPFGVGTTVRHLVEKDRQDPHVPQPRTPRELMIQIWYPTKSGISGERAKYRDSHTTSFWTSQLSLVRTNAVVDPPILPASKESGGYPVLIFSPSWSGQRVQNTLQVEELASHGYVVVAMDHPYGTAVTVFPDGRVVRSSIGIGEDYSSQAAFEEFIRKATDETEVRALDARFLLDTLERWNQQDPEGVFTGELRTTGVGIFGHSLGGSVAIQACWLDPRFKAAVDLDGMVAAESANEGAKKPVLFIMEEDSTESGRAVEALPEQKRRMLEFNRDQEGLMKKSLARYGGIWMEVAGATHRNFSDSPVFSPIKSLTGSGTTNLWKVFAVVNEYTLAFFDKHLKGKESPLLNSIGEYPVTKFQSWPTSGAE